MKSIAQPCAGVNAPCDVSTSHGVNTPHNSDPHTTLRSTPVSEALLAANRRLMARRSRGSDRPASGTAPRAATPPAENNTATVPAIVHALPPHLGWGSGRSAAVLRAQRRSGGRVGGCDPAADQQKKDGLRIDINPTRNPHKPKTTVKAYPSILNALLKQEQAAAGRVWLLCRHLDADGRG